MASILIVDDQPENRDYVARLLGYKGHRTLEAADGAAGLATVRDRHPDLVICDILMPTMDGFEFVRQLRADPAVADTEVVFYTAHYREREARRLAGSCGVSHILMKPCEPEDVLRVVNFALAEVTAAQPVPPAGDFDRAHLRLMTDKLAQHADELTIANARLAALTELNLQLASERDPKNLIEGVARGARQLFGAKYVVLGVRDKNGVNGVHYASSGFTDESVAQLRHPRIDEPVLEAVMKGRSARRIHNPSGDPVAIGLPASYPPVHSCVVAPVMSTDLVYGWMCLIDKLGAEEFSESDAVEASILGAQVGRIYENGSLYQRVKQYASELEIEIAGHEKAELALRQAERKYRSIFENAVEGMFRVSLKGAIHTANPALANMLGDASPAALMARITDIGTQFYADPAERQRVLELLERQGAVHGYEMQCLRKDGSRLWVSLSASVGQDEQTGMIHHLAMVEDITERKRVEYEVLRLNADLEKRVEKRTAQLAAANQELEAFSFSVSHDLRAPLRTIDFFSKQLQEENADKLDVRAKGYITRVRGACTRIGALVDDLLKLSRISFGELRIEKIDISALAQEIAAELAHAQPERFVDLEIGAGTEARGDAGLIRILLENLLGNAWKYTSKQPLGRIALAAAGTGAETVFSVQDNGVGFDMSYAAKLFAPFQRYHTAAEFEGNGIGLATVQRVVNRHGGKVWVESAVGAGTTVFWTLAP